jgi:hypothetical protein
MVFPLRMKPWTLWIANRPNNFFYPNFFLLSKRKLMRTPCTLCVFVSPLTPESSKSGARRDLSVCPYVYPPPLLLGNGPIHTFPRQSRIIGRVVFCAVWVMSKESRRSVIPRTYCCSSFKYTFNNSVCVASNDFMIMTWKWSGRKLSRPNWILEFPNKHWARQLKSLS